MSTIPTNLMMRRPTVTISHTHKNIFRLVSVITKIMPHKKLIASYRYVKNRNMSFLLLPWPCIPPTTFSVKIYTKLSRQSVYQIICGLFLVITFFRGFEWIDKRILILSFIFFHQRSIIIWIEMILTKNAYCCIRSTLEIKKKTYSLDFLSL